MSKTRLDSAIALGLIVFVCLACNRFRTRNEANYVFTPAPNTNTSPTPFSDRTEATSTSGDERQKPAAGKGNVQGKVLFNDQPAEGIEVKICENLSTIMGIECKGKSKLVKTGADGVYVLADLEPMTYGGLTAKVFKSNYYIYPYRGYSSLTPSQFTVQADKTIYADDINLFKDDLKVTSPRMGAKVDANTLQFKWNPYPGATYYRMSLLSVNSVPPGGERIEETEYTLPQTLTNGDYRLKLTAYNASDHKIAELADEIKFTVTGGTDPTPKTTP